MLLGGFSILAIAVTLWFGSFVRITVNTSTASSGKRPPQVSKQPDLTELKNQRLVEEIAKQVTVRVLSEPEAGSGVIIERQGETYSVLTCDHVVAGNKSNRYNILTIDGVTHPATRKSIKFGDVDLAVVQFQSKKAYKIADLGNSNLLSTGKVVYASGFPNYNSPNDTVLEDTRNWGNKAYRFTNGEISMILEGSLKQGYRLGYTNEVELGMSGGPVFNQTGQVVGINGRLKYPIQGIDVFTFADGTRPSVEMFQKMESLSWAIPIAAFRQAIAGSE
ncbi:MAG: trypsin-like peptidase domain-containing protein [Calothrix sp. CSU_2_0]|nr:trypsin-like peptidase domain-containing protein [Calothrix sp. CSU_2_0]